MDDHSASLWGSSVVDVLSRWRELNPGKTAYTFLNENGVKEDEITFAQLHRKVIAFAGQLRGQQSEGERIVILLPSGIDYIIAFLACLASGAIAVPLYPPAANRDWRRLRSVVANCEPKALVLNRALAARREELRSLSALQDRRRLIVVDELVLPASEPDVSVEIDPKGVAFLQYTSGSTGDPRGVMVTHESIMHNEHHMAVALGNDANAVIVSWLPFYHDMGMLGNVLQSLVLGAHGVLMSPYSFLRRPLIWLRAVSEYRGTHAGGPNFSYDLCVDKIKDAEIATLDLSSWRTAFNGAEPIKAATLERFHRRFQRAGFRKEMFFPCYGLAESTLFVAGGPLNEAPRITPFDRNRLNDGEAVEVAAHSGNGADNVLPCVGVNAPFHDQIVRIVDPATWTVLPERHVGEIWLNSRSVARGYWNKPKETAEAFYGYTTDSGEGPFLRTGDLGVLCDGHLYIAGRIKELVSINGVNHYPQDIEETVQSLSEHFRTHAGVAFGFGDDQLAVVQAINRSKAAPADFQAWIGRIRRSILRVHGIAPSFVGLVSPADVPKTSSGKIQRTLVKRRFLSNELKFLSHWRADAPSGEKPATPPPRHDATPNREPAAPAVREKIEWLRDYLEHRVNSYLIDERRTIPPYVVLDFGNQGLLGMQVPAQYGGLGYSTREFLDVMELLGSKDMTLALFVGLNNVLGVRPVLRFGTPAVKNQYLPLLASGRELAAFALTEPGAGSNPQAIEAAAQQAGAGVYRLHGTKVWSGSAAWCGLLNAFAKTRDRRGRSIGVTAFAVPQGSAGLRQGPEALTMGMRGMIQNCVFFEDVEVAESHVLGEPGHGMQVAQDAMCYGRLTIAAVCLGAMKLCYQAMLRYSGGRDIATGRLLDNPHTRFVLTETMHAIAAIEALIDSVAARMDAGESVAAEVLAVCKSVSTEWLWKTVDRTMQVAGGRGYIETNFIPQLLRDARIFRIFEGPTETLNHFVGSSAVKARDIIRRQLLTLLEEATVAERYDAVLDGLDADGAGGHADAAASHWRYITAGEYINHLFLYASGARDSVAPATRRWALEQLDAARLQLQAATGRFRDICPADTIRAFGASIDRRLGQREQHYPLPDTSVDPLLGFDGGSNGTGERGAAPAPVGEPPGAARPASRAVAAVANDAVRDDETPSVPRRAPAPAGAGKPDTMRDVQAFLSGWIARRCRRPVESISPDIEFAALGLGSIDSVELSADLSDSYEIDLDPTVFWNYPTVRELAGFVRSELDVRRRSSGPMVASGQGGRRQGRLRASGNTR